MGAPLEGRASSRGFSSRAWVRSKTTRRHAALQKLGETEQKIPGFLFACIRVIRGPLLFRHSGFVIFSDLLPADEDQNAGCQCQDSGHDRGDTNVKERGDSNKDQIDGEQKHSEIFGDVHTSVLEANPAGLHA